MSNKEIFNFNGKDVDVEWDGRLCIHIAECGQSTGELFIGGRQPWCIPDKAEPEDVVDIVERCPTGALTYQLKNGSNKEQAKPENTLMVACNGPYFLLGDLEIEGATDDMPGVRFRAALCRCGQSKNKPFCDNSHEDAKFKDYGAVGDKGPGIEADGGKLNVRAIKDGPIILEGNMTMVAGSGRVAWKGKKASLCRCGASKNKPFCDGSHMGINFKS